MATTTRTHRATVDAYDRPLAVGSTVAALAAMAVDHLMGDDPGLEDVPMFLIASALSLILALAVWGWVVPKARDASPGRTGLILGVLAIVPGVATLWLGLPFVLAGGGLALGLHSWRLTRDRLSAGAVIVAVLVLVSAGIAYMAQAMAKLT